MADSRVLPMPVRSFASQGVHTILYKAVALVVVFVSGILTARWLGPEGKGALSVYFAAAAMVVPLAELGVRQSVAYMTGQKVHPEPEIYQNMKWLFLVTSAISVVIVASLFRGMGFIERYGWPLSLIFMGMIPLGLYESYNSGILIARKSIEKINYLALMDKVNTLVFMLVAVVLLDGGVLGAASGYFLAKAVNFCMVNYWIREYWSLRPRATLPVMSKMLKRGFMFSVALFFIQLNYRLGVLMLENLADTYDVGIYSVGLNFAEMLKEVPLALGVVLFSRSANWTGKDLKDSIGKAALLSRVVFSLMVGLGSLLGLMAHYCIPLFYGRPFAESAVVTWILLPGVIMLSVFLILNLFLAGQGKPHVSIIAFLPAIALNVVLNFLWIPQHGFIGAAVSSTLSYCLATLVFAVAFVRMHNLKLADLFVLRKSDVSRLRGQFSASRG